MLLSQVVQMSAAFILAALVFSGRVQIWHILTLSGITGCAQAFAGPAYQSLVPTLVGKEHLPNAIALNSIQFNLARVIGPVVAGAALASFGMVMCFGLNGILPVRHRRDPRPAQRAHPAGGHRAPGGSDEGRPQACRRSTNLKSLTLLGFIAAFLATLLTFLPVIAKDVFQQDVASTRA
ncbi:MAG: MFS transporter [Vicinamibacterales bacterium]